MQPVLFQGDYYPHTNYISMKIVKVDFQTLRDNVALGLPPL